MLKTVAPAAPAATATPAAPRMIPHQHISMVVSDPSERTKQIYYGIAPCADDADLKLGRSKGTNEKCDPMTMPIGSRRAAVASTYALPFLLLAMLKHAYEYENSLAGPTAAAIVAMNTQNISLASAVWGLTVMFWAWLVLTVGHWIYSLAMYMGRVSSNQALFLLLRPIGDALQPILNRYAPGWSLRKPLGGKVPAGCDKLKAPGSCGPDSKDEKGEPLLMKDCKGKASPCRDVFTGMPQEPAPYDPAAQPPEPTPGPSEEDTEDQIATKQ